MTAYATLQGDELTIQSHNKLFWCKPCLTMQRIDEDTDIFTIIGYPYFIKLNLHEWLKQNFVHTLKADTAETAKALENLLYE